MVDKGHEVLMAQDDIIAQLVDETFGSEFERPRVVSNRDADFDLMTQLSKLPIQFFKGHHVSDDLIEFVVAGKILHVSFKHLDSHNLKTFSAVIQNLVNHKIDASTLVKSQSCLWFLGWDTQEGIKPEQILQIFQGKPLKQAA
jgi:hypothetical protein